MSRRATGALFIIAAAMLYATRYLAAAIFGSGLSSHNSDLFNAMLQYTGQGLVTWCRVALLAGIIYLVWAELSELRKKLQP